MQFLYSAYLFGLLFIGIPVIIHLFNFQRAKKVYFTNVIFLKAIQEESNSYNKLKNILILLSRILLIIFLVLTLSQPYFSNNTSQATKQQYQYVNIYLDNSHSLENKRSDKYLLYAGVDYVEKISNLFSPQSRFQLISNDFSGYPNNFDSKKKILGKLEEFTYANVGRTLKKVSETYLDVIHPNLSHHVFLLSDFQKSTIGNLLQLTWDSLHHYYIIPLTPDSKSNVYIDSVWLENPFIRPLENNLCYVRIVNTGDENLKDKIIKLYGG